MERDKRHGANPFAKTNLKASFGKIKGKKSRSQALQNSISLLFKNSSYNCLS